MDLVLDETRAEYGHLMCDFFEIIRGNIGQLAPDVVMSVRPVTVLTCLGKKYGVGSWIRMGDSSTLGLVCARILSMYSVNNELFMVLSVYEMQQEPNGAFELPDAAEPPKQEIVAVNDMVYMAGLWSVGRNADDSGLMFIENPV